MGLARGLMQQARLAANQILAQVSLANQSSCCASHKTHIRHVTGDMQFHGPDHEIQIDQSEARILANDAKS